MHDIAEHIKGGGIAIYPTDTAYAIGCAFDDTKSIKAIMKIKGRTDNRFTIIASSLAQVEKQFKLNACQRRLARKYWPGPLSIVVSKKYAVRVPRNSIARSLARRVGKPLIATSVNISGQTPCYDLAELDPMFQRDDVVIHNVGPLQKRQPSTVVECQGGRIVIHRIGSITPK